MALEVIRGIRALYTLCILLHITCILFIHSFNARQNVLLKVRVDLHLHGMWMSFQKHGRPEMSRQLETPPTEGLLLPVLLSNIPHEAGLLLAQNQIPQLRSTKAGAVSRRLGFQLKEGSRSKDRRFCREIRRMSPRFRRKADIGRGCIAGVWKGARDR